MDAGSSSLLAQNQGQLEKPHGEDKSHARESPRPMTPEGHLLGLR